MKGKILVYLSCLLVVGYSEACGWIISLYLGIMAVLVDYLPDLGGILKVIGMRGRRLCSVDLNQEVATSKKIVATRFGIGVATTIYL